MKFSARAYDFAAVLDQAPAGVRILSLDCFDTLLWRNCNAPADVFADLPLQGMEARGWGETKARRVVALQTGRQEVTIEEIYAHHMPRGSEAEHKALVEAELQAEAKHCYGFAPTIALMRAAKARGLQIVIVSDTYLSKEQLRWLIAKAAGEDVVALIDHIFVSSEYGRTKSGGLFTPVLAALRAPAATILHCGDNHVADVSAPDALGIHCCHLEQFDKESDQRLRFEAIAATIADARTRVSIPAYQPHRPAVAMRSSDDPALRLGHDVLGPVFHSFTEWLHEEAAAQAARTGKPTKLLFLLRDGYLPALAYLARYPEAADQVAMIEISRLTAARAGMTDKQAVESYVLTDLPIGLTETFAMHLHFSEADAKYWGTQPKAKFAAHIVKPEILKTIVERSQACADKLFAHLARNGVEEGDSVMLVDLGYNGSVQNLIEPLLRDRLNLTVSGRYLLLRETWISGFDKAGFADARRHDLKLLHALSDSIAIVEQLCTIAQGSTIDYASDGTPIHQATNMKSAQSHARDTVQAACLDYVRNPDVGIHRKAASDTADARDRAAVAALARLLFLPMESEVQVFRDFAHDVNFGTTDEVEVLDEAAATEGLRRRGLFYVKNATRMYMPGELRPHGLPINFSLFTSRRYGLDMRKTDFDVGAIQLPVILMHASGEHLTVDIDAFPTTDGYYRALVPVGAGDYTVGVQLGRLAQWAQIEEAIFQPVDAFLDKSFKEATFPADYMVDGIDDMGNGLLNCSGGDAAFILVPPPAAARGKGDALLLSLVFRPVVLRQPQQAEAAQRAAA